ncbi:MAG TPA: hypothetical protein VKF84_11300 [Candidatus Sulfotelmatobacter sp.]|nr:hypothetical protein [Candidatus Sulfotelmatobacter sp.]
MWWVLLGHIVVPLVFGFAFVVFATASSIGPPTWDVTFEMALDFAVLGIGATGAIFENDAINVAYGAHSAVIGITVVGANFLLSSVIMFIRRYVFEGAQNKLLWSCISIGLGCLCLVTTSFVLAHAYGAV